MSCSWIFRFKGRSVSFLQINFLVELNSNQNDRGIFILLYKMTLKCTWKTKQEITVQKEKRGDLHCHT